jgi:zinc transport system ATP-binding protein
MSDALIKLKDVHVQLGGKEILRGLTADLDRGRITALIGRNGSGKTTLLRAILKEVPYTGKIEFRCGHDHSHPLPEHIGYVPQRLQIDARLPLTVRDLMALALQKRRPLFLGISRKAEATMHTLLEKVGAGTLLDRLVEKLSGGELQRVLLALALHPEPELLLLDEPAAGIDFTFQDKFYELIASLNRTMGVTILLVSHEMDVVSKHAHHVLCMKDGQITCQGPPQDIVTGEMLSQTFGAEARVYAHHH